MTVAPPTEPEVDGDQPLDEPEPARVELPRSGGGERRRRREDRRQRRRRTLTMAGTVVAAVAIVAGVLTYGWNTLRELDRNAGPATPAGLDPGTAGGPLARTLLVHEGGSGDLVSVTVLATGQDEGDVLFLPPGAMVEVPSFGLDALRDAYDLGGVPLLESSVENLLGAELDEVVVVDAADLEGVVGSVGSVVVDVPASVERVRTSGRVEVLFAEGPVEVEPGEVGALLAEPGLGTDVERLVRHQRFWQSLLLAASVQGSEDAGQLTEDGARLWRSVRSLASGEVDYHVLPVEALGTSEFADGELYRVRFDGLADLLARIAPDVPAGRGVERIEVQVLNGTGEPGVSQRVQPTLVPAGASVVLTGNAANFDYATTQVVYYDEGDLDAARTVQEALGVGEVVRSLSELGVVDVTVVVGADFDQAGES